MKWTTLGWNGITVELPEDWELSGLSGDDKSGYLRLEDADMPRLELKWSESKQKKPDLQRVLDDYFKLVRKNYKRRDTNLHIQRNVKLIKDPQFFENREVVFFNWKGEFRASGVIFHCQICKRITIVQVMGHLKENIRDTTSRIFKSVQDHPVGQATLWSAYQLNAEIPRRYRLDKHKLLSGYLLLSFVDGSRKVSIERYGIADVTLKDQNLEEWFRGRYAKAIRGYGFSIESSNGNADEQLTLIGEETRIIDRVPFAPALVIDKVMRRKTFAINLWACHHSNRIYVVQAIAKQDAAKTAEDIAASIQYHEHMKRDA